MLRRSLLWRNIPQHTRRRENLKAHQSILNPWGPLSSVSFVLQIRIFNTLAGVLFLAAGAVALQNWREFRNNMKGKHEDADKEKAGVFLLTTGTLCLVNSLLYLADVAVSVHSTLSSP
jgi:hypothetical protein